MEMKILITGGAGYIASHIVQDLIEEGGHQILVIDDLSSGSRDNVLPESDSYRFIEADATKSKGLQELQSFAPDVIYHFAAFKAAGESMIRPEKFARNNISGTISIIEAMVECGCKNFVFSSSAAVYGEPEYVPIDEDHPKNPINYYGYTKRVIEENLEWFSKLRGIRYASLRYFNAAGYDIHGRVTGLEIDSQNLMPIVMEVATGQREELTIYGDDYDTPDGTCIRDYVHVNDLSRAHVMAMHYLESENKNLIVNLGSQSGLSVLEILKASREASGAAIDAKMGARRPGDPPVLIASSKKAKDILNWETKYSDADTLARSMWNVYKNQ